MNERKLSPFYKYGIINKINQKWKMVDEYRSPYDENYIEARGFVNGAMAVLAAFGYQLVFEDERRKEEVSDIIPLTL